ncbi:hypothetical protein DRO32_05100 [Candidatus Bathyarchaeota archaeon]|nr:MAG: hypothetical protein DRO32_05100 [Candidatus Bathyarchaeota archaeon]
MFAFLFTTTIGWASIALDVKLAVGELRKVIPSYGPSGPKWLILLASLALVGYAHGCHTLRTPAHIYALWFLALRALAFLVILATAKAMANVLKAEGGALRQALAKRMTKRVVLKAVGAIVLLVILIEAPVAIPMINRPLGTQGRPT